MNVASLEKWVKILFVSLGIILTVTIAFSTLGYISNSKVHYANFALGIMLLSALYAVLNYSMTLEKTVTRGDLFLELAFCSSVRR